MSTEKDQREERMWKRFGLSRHLSTGIAALIVICLSVLFAFCLLKISSIIGVIKGILLAATPIIYGLCIAFVLKPVYNRLQQWMEKDLAKGIMKKHPEKADGFSKTVSSIIVVLLLTVLVALVLILLVPELYNSVINLTDNLPDYIDGTRDWLHEKFKNNPKVDETVMQYFDNFMDMDKGFIGVIFPEIGAILGMVTSGLSSMLGLIYNIFIGLIVAIYILNEKETLLAQARKIGNAVFKPSHKNWLSEEIRYADKMFSGYVFARFVDSIILGVTYAILGSIFKVPYVGMISVVVGITNMIPFFGPYIGAIPCAIILFMISPLEALKFFIIDMVIMQFDANVISPKIIGNTTGLSGFWVLFAILFFGGLWGFLGMLIGVPLFAVIYHLICSLVDMKLERRELSTNLEDYIVEPVVKSHKGKIKQVIQKVGGNKDDKNQVDNTDNTQ